MTTSKILFQMTRLGFIYDEVASSTQHHIFWYSYDGYSSSRIEFTSLRSALRFAKDRS